MKYMEFIKKIENMEYSREFRFSETVIDTW